jgi:hypothetical protein
MLYNLILIKHDHLPTQQTPQLWTDDFLLLGSNTLCNRIPDAIALSGIGACSATSGRAGSICCDWLSLSNRWCRKVVLLIHGLNSALKAAEETLSADESGLEINGVGELVNYVSDQH